MPKFFVHILSCEKINWKTTWWKTKHLTVQESSKAIFVNNWEQQSNEYENKKLLVLIILTLTIAIALDKNTFTTWQLPRTYANEINPSNFIGMKSMQTMFCVSNCSFSGVFSHSERICIRAVSEQTSSTRIKWKSVYLVLSCSWNYWHGCLFLLANSLRSANWLRITGQKIILYKILTLVRLLDTAL